MTKTGLLKIFQPELLKICIARLVRSHDMPGFRKFNHILIDLATKVNKIVIGRYNIMQLYLDWDFFCSPHPHTYTYTIDWLLGLCSDSFFFYTPGLRAGSTHFMHSYSLQLSTILAAVVLLLNLGRTPSSCLSVVCVICWELICIRYVSVDNTVTFFPSLSLIFVTISHVLYSHFSFVIFPAYYYRQIDGISFRMPQVFRPGMTNLCKFR